MYHIKWGVLILSDLLCDVNKVVCFPAAWVNAQQQAIHGGHHGRGPSLTTSVKECPGLLKTCLNQLKAEQTGQFQGFLS